MTLTASPQLSLALEGDAPTSTPSRPKRKPKPHHRPRSDGPLLPLAQPRFLPVVGVPKTRADCPDTTDKHCPHLRCRWNLALVTSDTRAGRPGLSHVPRDSRGWTLPTAGHAGDERPGTTAEPRWLELERYCTVWIERDENNIVAVNAVYEGEWEEFRGALHPGEPLDVLGEAGERLCGATVREETVVLERDPGAFMVKLRRVRGVPSCALDEIVRKGKMSNEQIGDAIGRHRTLVAREIKEAVKKACERAEEMGMDAEDFVGALMGMGQGK